jgi:hypothetical protein
MCSSGNVLKFFFPEYQGKFFHRMCFLGRISLQNKHRSKSVGPELLISTNSKNIVLQKPCVLQCLALEKTSMLQRLVPGKSYLQHPSRRGVSDHKEKSLSFWKVFLVSSTDKTYKYARCLRKYTAYLQSWLGQWSIDLVLTDNKFSCPRNWLCRRRF